MSTLETDYLIVGAGAVGLAFADTLLEETEAEIVIVDRHGKPGGHWNDAYSFVSLHQPSAFYGVASLPLGSGRKDAHGVNAGLYELASGHEVSGYFDRVMHRRLLASGRVRYLPMTEHVGDGRCVSLLSGGEMSVTARRRIVDATYYGTNVPATHTPKFAVADGVRLVPPNALPDLWRTPGRRPSRFTIVGAGKTAMDVGVWLLSAGAEPGSITWVVPRDSWLLNRRTTQPGAEFFDAVFGAQLAQMTALAEAGSAAEVFARLEAAGMMLRIDPAVTPSMFHYATISTGEVAELRRLRNVVRLGRVLSIGPTDIELTGGRVASAPDTLFVDCTATAVERRPPVPVFAPGRIILQMVRIPQPAFSAALCAYLEARLPDDDARNAVSRPIPLPDGIEQYPAACLVNMMNQHAWGRDKALRSWIANCRLDGFGRIVDAVEPTDHEKIDLLKRIGAQAMAAAANIPKIMQRANQPAR
jgi:hypothetical protein